MAGSYNHVVTDKGNLRSNESFSRTIDNLGDAYEVIEEMYGMIWYLADRCLRAQVSGPPSAMVEEARQHYKEGLAWAKILNGGTNVVDQFHEIFKLPD